jgi:hypothetical protein
LPALGTLVALWVEDLAGTPDELQVAVRQSKTDREGQGAQRPVRDRLGIQFRLALPPLVVAGRRMLGHGLHSAAGSEAGQGQQNSGQTHLPGSIEGDPGSSEASGAVPAGK